MLEYISSLQGQGQSQGDAGLSGRGRGRGLLPSASAARGSPDHENCDTEEYPDYDSSVDKDADGVCFENLSLSPVGKYDRSPNSSTSGQEEEEEDATTSKMIPSSSAIAIPRRQIPTLSEKIDFLKSLDSAASRLFHRKTGLPLTSSPAPLRKGQDRFDFDSSLVSGTRMTSRFRRGCHPPRYGIRRVPGLKRNFGFLWIFGFDRFSEATRALLGPFEESVLNGRIEVGSIIAVGIDTI